MTQTVNINVPRALTPEERHKVQAYAEALVASARPEATGSTPRHLDVAAIAGIFEKLGSEKTGVELAHEANEIRAAKGRG